MTTPARRLALDAFDCVLSERRFLDEALRRRGDQFLALEPRDRGFARMLLLTGFRRLGEIDAALDRRLQRPLPEDASIVRHILRLGLVELQFLGAPPHAAIDSAVEAAKQRAPRFAGLVNAVLRGIAREGWPEPSTEISPEIAQVNTPDWFWDLLVKDYGSADAALIAAGQLQPAPLDVTAKTPQNAAEVAESLGGEITPTGTIRLTAKGDPSALPGYAEGAWWVQDAAAAMPVQLLAPQPDERVLDLCAAPGGKTLQIAAAGARAAALDISEWRLARVSENLARIGLQAEVLHADALTWRPDHAFPAVLLDAPCSATGTIRRHPEALHIKSAAGLGDLTKLQDRLLDAAWEMVAPGGRMVFCVCSLAKLEGEERAEAFLSRAPDAAPYEIPASSPLAPWRVGVSGAESAGLRTTPVGGGAYPMGLDGFFVMRFDKRHA